MFIRLLCQCGVKLKVPQEAAGRLANCPKCGRHVQIPNDLTAVPHGTDDMHSSPPRRPWNGDKYPA